MSLYIRALTMYSDVVIMYVALLLLDVLLPQISYWCKTTTTKFISKTLPTYGWRITFPFRIDRDNVHHVQRRGNCIPLILCSFLCMTSGVELGYVMYRCWNCDFLPYTFWALLQLMYAIALWYKEIKWFLTIYKRTEYLHVVEICQCCTNAFKSILLLKGYHGEYYTYVVENTEHWQIDVYHKALCVGNYIDKLDEEIVEPTQAIWVGVGDKCVYRGWNGVLCPIALIVLGLATLFLFYTFRFLSILVAGIILVTMGVIYMPWQLRRSLRAISMVHTECFDDLGYEAYWTYVLINRGGKPFYYQSDDDKVLQPGHSYYCITHGNTVDVVEDETPKEYQFVYQAPSECKELFILYLITIPCIVGCEFIGWVIPACLTTALSVLIAIVIGRYKHKGDI